MLQLIGYVSSRVGQLIFGVSKASICRLYTNYVQTCYYLLTDYLTFGFKYKGYAVFTTIEGTAAL